MGGGEHMNYIISICDPKAAPKLTEICSELGLRIAVSLHGRGTAVRSMLDILGIEDNEKRVILTIANRKKTKEFIREQKRRLFIGVPGHGVAVAVPIKSIGGGKTVAFLNGEQQIAKYTPELNYAYELITVIANEGRSDLVMNAARSAGAKGGTVLHGKSTGAKDSEKFYNISIFGEKEVILIVAEAAQKSEIMRSILKNAGPDSEAGAIVFSMPVSEVAGFGMFDS